MLWFNDITITYINVDMVTSYCVYTIINNTNINRLVEVIYRFDTSKLVYEWRSNKYNDL